MACKDAVSGTEGKVKVFKFDGEWEGKYYEEKEVTVYYKAIEGKLILLTAKARYGKKFERKNSL